VLDNETDAKTFERLCVDLLGREGYPTIVQVGGTRDHGRDAEILFWHGLSEATSKVFFQFSLDRRWEPKLRREAGKIVEYGHAISDFIFVTSRTVTGEKQDVLKKEFKAKFGWNLTIYHREWLRHRLEDRHPDLAEKHLHVAVPTTPHHVEMALTFSGLNEDSIQALFRDVSPEQLKASLLQKIKSGSPGPETWHTLAKVEYQLRDYDAALRSVNEALRNDPARLERLNLKLFKGAILAEQGVKTHSRPLLVQAKEIFADAVDRIGRAQDHYNLGNVLGPLSDLDGAEEQYRLCLAKKPDYAQAWKNLGCLLCEKGEHEEEMKCYEKALQLKPDLVEAYLSMGRSFLVDFKKPQESVRCFLEAYKMEPGLDERWSHARFWLSEALFAVGKLDEALRLVEIGLSNGPDDPYLLQQKARFLSKLWRGNTKYEDAALAYFKFRALAIPNDYGSLVELIDLFTKKGSPDEAWAHLQSNLNCAPYLLLPLKERAKLSLEDFRVGFRHFRVYERFRSAINLEDHLITLRQYGLNPDRRMLGALNLLLMIPFGHAFEQLRGTKGSSDEVQTFDAVWEFITRIFPAFGVSWISSSKPGSREEQLKLLSKGLFYVSEAALAEASRVIGFISGIFGQEGKSSKRLNSERLREIYADVGVPLMESALVDWNLVPDDWSPTFSKTPIRDPST
jgi:tetratricopeptide (TPR) repeat protein